MRSPFDRDSLRRLVLAIGGAATLDRRETVTVPDQLTAREAIEMGVAKRLKVVLDGTEVHAVNAYCMSEGWVDVYSEDVDGKFIVEGDHFKLERRIGKVEVTLDESD